VTSATGVVLAWLFPEQTNGFFTKSLADLVLHDCLFGGHHLDPRNGGGFISLSTGPRIAEARNTIVDLFAEQYPDTEWLLMVDTDMVFAHDMLDRLMAAAHPIEAPIVGGLCFAGGRSSSPYPTIYRNVNKVAPDGREYINIERVYDYPRDAVVKVAATGGACLLVHRQAYAVMKKHYGYRDGVPHPYPWFAEGIVGPEGEMWGEDTAFCLRANALNIPVHVDTTVKLGHRKMWTIDEVFYDNQRRAQELTDEGAFGDVPRETSVHSNRRSDPDALHTIIPEDEQLNRAQRRQKAREKVN
jgi:hypothetical protein